MKKIIYSTLALSLLFSGCATVEKVDISNISTPSDNISKTLQVDNTKPTGLKRKVAISRFTNETKYGQSFFVDKSNNKIGKQAMDILSAKLFQSGKFIMLERADMSNIESELKLGNMAKLDNSADYIIVGSITEFGRKNTSDVGVFSRTKKQEVFAKVHIRIVDVSSGVVIYSDEGKGSSFSEAGTIMGLGGKAGYNAQLNDKAIEAAISNLTSNIIENMLDKPWKGYILDYQDGSLISSGGKSQNIKSGDKFDIFKKGRVVKNPQTNMNITLPGKKLATMEVVATVGETLESEVTLSTITSGDISSYIAKKDFTQLYIQVGAK